MRQERQGWRVEVEGPFSSTGYGSAVESWGFLREVSWCVWVQRCAGSPPSSALPICCFSWKQPDCCQSQNVLLLANGWGVCVKGPFKREAQITSAIFHFADLFLLVTDISVTNGHLMGWEFRGFSKWLHGCFSDLRMCVCARVVE